MWWAWPQFIIRVGIIQVTIIGKVKHCWDSIPESKLKKRFINTNQFETIISTGLVYFKGDCYSKKVSKIWTQQKCFEVVFSSKIVPNFISSWESMYKDTKRNRYIDQPDIDRKLVITVGMNLFLKRIKRHVRFLERLQ